MARQAINCSALPPAIGPYSHAVRVGNTLYVSGAIPVDPETGQVVGGPVGEQARRVLANLRLLLVSEGLGLGDVVKTTVFLSDMAHFAEMNDVYARFFPEAPPARSTVAVLGLPKGVDVEIDCIAAYPE